MEIVTKRIYQDVGDDGARVLVDRLWPRGVSKEEAQLDAWITELAPSEELRTWYDHDLERWPEFRERYVDELEANDDALEHLREVAEGSDRVTLLYAASDREHNNAVVLREFLREREF